jgi:dTMP kinase
MFITFEGGEGSGKTSLITNIYNALSKTYDVIKTREPGGSQVAEAIRDVVLNHKYQGITPHTEALLFAASRAQHLDEVIIPALKQNKIVLCDRYIDSSLAYQAFARELGLPFVLDVNQYALLTMPELTFYIDLDPNEGLGRIANRSKYDRLDQETMLFHEKVRNGYLELVKLYPNRLVKINGHQSLEAITKEMLEIIYKKL